ncbi:hypothetical protein BST81_10415 [Leptolyngbya sp. 'hensonii']|uniref:WD40 domain-containing protein n=1 Tax=Leptolyngbya sp. 'hensonii' TaxID=1922337 RepID=UPI00094FEF5C|nr:hypothetical protein [Leptolyngbya sp. 'hensonii']OLP18488.1 hypothetical protein BST81_10415 [Leptolyngbya sp. 'hensonii']
MVNWQRSTDVEAYNDRALHTLMRAIAGGNPVVGEAVERDFVLILVRCNYAVVRERVLARLRAECSLPFQELTIPETARTLYTTIQTGLTQPLPAALVVLGLEAVIDIEALLTSTNQVREEFRKQLPLSLVLWVNDLVLQKLTRLAPDFKNWAATPIKFDISTGELVPFLRQRIDSVFTMLLETGAGLFLEDGALDQALGGRWRSELELAQRDLQHREHLPEPEVEAGLQFLLGRDAEIRGDRLEAQRRYEASLTYWQHRGDRSKQGCVLFYLGLWWRQQAILDRVRATEFYQKAGDYFRQSLAVFEQGQRPDLAAKFINGLGEVLARLQAWDELAVVAHKAQLLHEQYPDGVRRAYDLGLLAEVALARSDWPQVKALAEAALQTLTQTRAAGASQEQTLDWADRHHQSWYLLLLAQAQEQMGQVAEAIWHLAQARARSSPEYDPRLYLRILEGLRSLYFGQGRYRDAFQLKQEQALIEFQYNLRAFAGAAHLEPKRPLLNPGLPKDQPTIVAQEIAASGRQQDLERLMARLNRADCKLIVLHGQSGVGKSSILMAGLLPLLRQRGLGERDALPIVLKVYTDWVRTLGWALTTELEILRGLRLPLAPDLTPDLLEQLRENGDLNLLTVLIFDQFEEFFTTYPGLTERRPFYQFLLACLNIPFVKVILPIREDALHRLLELERLEPDSADRLQGLDILNHNILDKNIRYYLGNFSPAEARSVIYSLTERSQFYLELSLIDELVRDLAANTGDVRPIELQIVGAQLQAEKITTLAAYHQRGPKEHLVARSLETVVQDCGPENEPLARIVLYLLTEDSNNRPLKTRHELISDLETLGLSADLEKLDLVLEVLVGSGLVFQIPEVPVDRYQLMHDYLIDFIRQQQTPEMSRLVSELEVERQLRSLTQEELRQALQQLGTVLEQEQQERYRAEIAEIDALSVSSQALLLSYDQLGALVASVKACERLLQTDVPPSKRMQTIARLHQVLYALRERNRLSGHSGTVWALRYHPQGKGLASAGNDGTIRLWKANGRAIRVLEGHDSSVNDLRFTPDGTGLVSAGEDGTIRLWHLESGTNRVLQRLGEAVNSISFSPDGLQWVSAGADGVVRLWPLAGGDGRALKGHNGPVSSAAFSPDGQLIVSGAADGLINLWQVDGTIVHSWKGHENAVSRVRFSPDGRLIASAGEDGLVWLWTLNGREFYALEGHQGPVWDLEFSHDGHMLVSAGSDRTLKLWNLSRSTPPEQFGTELQTFRRHHAAVWAVSLSPDGQTLASSGADSVIKLWSLFGLSLSRLLGHSNLVWGVSYSPDGRTIATTSADGTLKLWSVAGQELRTLLGHRAGVWMGRFSPDGRLIASASADSTVRLWTLEGQEVRTLQGHQGSVRGVSFSPDGQLLASASADGTVKLWTLEGLLLRTLEGHQGSVWDVDFSSDGRLIASASDDRTVKLWSSEGEELQTLQGHSSIVWGVCFSPDSQMIAAAGDDRTIHLWQADGTPLRTLQGHAGSVWAVAFSPDGQVLASASADRTVRLWGLDGTELQTFTGHTAGVWSVAFSPDGQELASASTDRSVILWNLNLEDLLQRSRDWLQDYQRHA